jgi:hypothetical protein
MEKTDAIRGERTSVTWCETMQSETISETWHKFGVVDLVWLAALVACFVRFVVMQPRALPLKLFQNS